MQIVFSETLGEQKTTRIDNINNIIDGLSKRCFELLYLQFTVNISKKKNLNLRRYSV